MRPEQELREHARKAEELSKDQGRPDSVYLNVYANALKWALEEEPSDTVKSLQSWVESYPK